MFIKVILLVIGMTAYTYSTDQFDPEKAEFSKMNTLKTWVASSYTNDEDQMRKLQRNVAMMVPENNYSINFVRVVPQNPNEMGKFGKTFQTLAGAELPFLQFVHETSKTKAPVVLEIAAARGLVTWKIPYCFETTGTVYASELSSVVLDKDFKMMMRARLNESQQALIHTLPGNCLEIAEKEPSLIGSVDAIYVQNLEHFFNPIQHQKFLTLLSTLLAPNGRAFLISHTLETQLATSGNPVFELYKTHKDQEIYPGFMKVLGISHTLLTGHLIGEYKILKAERPVESTLCEKVTLEDTIVSINGMEAHKTKEDVTSNFYTPTIYKNSIRAHPSLSMIDTYFLSGKGVKYTKFSESPLITHAMAILEKNGNSSS